MPASATITAFYSFTAGQKARATQVNNNFNMFRGHVIPIDPNTIAAANNTYDLGSTDYRWRAIYLRTDAGTTTASVGGFAYNNISVKSFLTYTSSDITASAVTISTIGRPVEYGFLPNAADGTNSYFGMFGSSGRAIISYMRDGVTIGVSDISGDGYLPISSIRFIDKSPTAGTYTYSIRANLSSSGTAANFVRIMAFAKEL